MARGILSLRLLSFLSAFYAVSVVADVDYVIVGGGPAGLVVAERLSRNPNVTVTLLEAGPDVQTIEAVESKRQSTNCHNQLN